MIRVALALTLFSGTAFAADRVEVVRLPVPGPSVEDAIALHARLFGGEAVVAAGTVPGTLVIQDTREGIARFRSFIEMLDIQDNRTRIFVRPVIRPPSELAALVRETGLGHLRIIPDDRTSQIVVVASTEEYRALHRLLARLDPFPFRRSLP